MCPYVDCGLVFLYVCSHICGTGTCGSCVCVPMRNVDLWVLCVCSYEECGLVGPDVCSYEECGLVGPDVCSYEEYGLVGLV